MKKLVVLGLTTLVAMLGLVVLAPAAQAYPDLSCSVDLDAQTVNGGDSFTATGTSQQFSTPRLSGRAAADAVNWEMSFNGDVRTGTGETFTQTFQVPVVAKIKKIPLHAKAVMPGGTPSCEKTVDITILPGGTTVEPPGGGLPNTGGPRLVLLLAGLGLVIAGGVAIRQSRKGHDAA
jgi:hypothetical protein